MQLKVLPRDLGANKARCKMQSRGVILWPCESLFCAKDCECVTQDAVQTGRALIDSMASHGRSNK
jgi:hypothetical protein